MGNAADDMLEGAQAIADYLRWKVRRVYRAHEEGWSAPIRKREFGLYAFKSELDAWLRAPESLPSRAA